MERFSEFTVRLPGGVGKGLFGVKYAYFGLRLICTKC
jgi:hypothetical protein